MTDDQSDSEAKLFDLIELITDQLQNGEQVDLPTLLANYPQFANRLTQIFPAIQMISGLASISPMLNGVLGDFRIICEIGRGGMGVVYQAEQISLSRKVALKVLPSAALVTPRNLERFKNEARAAATLQHPHIVPIYTVGFERGIHFYTMKLIDGHTLADECRPFLEHPGRADWNRVVEIGIQISEALEYAHQVGVIHRDVKPANIIIDQAGVAWLADFGLAQLRCDNGISVTGEVLGTLRYMSPEQANGIRSIDHRTDIYSLGVTLYELLTRRPAFQDSDQVKLLRLVLEQQPISPRRFYSDSSS